jgi:16S rRNA (guanine966-N2)-methyltransferase
MLRIIAGTARGIRLSSPEGRNVTRPTLGRVRESIFNVLANLGIIDSRVLDIFAGTGAMGLEALSRGAAKAWFIDRATSRLIRENAKKCHVEDKCVILGGDVMRALTSLKGQVFDYIFMDPPYDRGYINRIVKALFTCRLTAEGTVLIVEHTVKEPLDLEGLAPYCTVWKEKKTGETLVTYLLCHKQENL